MSTDSMASGPLNTAYEVAMACLALAVIALLPLRDEGWVFWANLGICNKGECLFTLDSSSGTVSLIFIVPSNTLKDLPNETNRADVAFP